MNDKKNVEKSEKVDILDEIRHIERQIKQQILLKAVTDLKDEAKKIKRMKLKTQLKLAEMGLSEADAKRVIDFINESSESQLSDEEIKELRREAIQEVKGKKKEMVEKMEKNPQYGYFMNANAGDITYYKTAALNHVDPLWQTHQPFTSSIDDNGRVTLTDSTGSTASIKV